MMSVKRHQWKAVLLSSLVLMGLSHCSSQPSGKSKVSGILEEVRPEEESTNQAGASDNPLLINISEKLQSLGYEALGLQFETDDTLLLLGKIFDSPVSHDRQIRLIYTGLAMSYDSKHQSLTIGESKDLGSILIFIDKNIPKRNSSEQINKLPPVSMPTLPTTDKQSSSIDKIENSSTLNLDFTSTTVTTVPTRTLSPAPVVPKVSNSVSNPLNYKKAEAKSSKKKLHSKKLKGKNLVVKPSKKDFKDSKKIVTPVPVVSSSTTEPQPPTETAIPTVTTEPQPPAEAVIPAVTTEPQPPAEAVIPTVTTESQPPVEAVIPTVTTPSSTVAPSSSTISPSTTETPEAIPE